MEDAATTLVTSTTTPSSVLRATNIGVLLLILSEVDTGKAILLLLLSSFGSVVFTRLEKDDDGRARLWLLLPAMAMMLLMMMLPMHLRRK